mmetsp:Transcript_137373/g.274095  ORF Transcript_137373/g.274095 Transcript_137373/m.274095 type:complete len:512 (+) Transcript_137373:79-1614(+)
MQALSRVAPLVNCHARVLRQAITAGRPRPHPIAYRAISALAPTTISWPEPVLSADDLEGVLRSSFKSLGCTTVAVLERCRLGERGVSAEIHDGLWIQAWIAGGTVLWVIPNIPQLSMMVRDPALSCSVMSSLLEYGAGRKESFFMGPQPLTVGYKFGPVRPEILRSPAALGDHLDDVLTMVQQQARIIALESRVVAGLQADAGTAAALPASMPALPAPEERPECETAGRVDSAVSVAAANATAETLRASTAASVATSAGASKIMPIARPTPGGGEPQQDAQSSFSELTDAPPTEASEPRVAAVSPASEREAQLEPTNQGSGGSQEETGEAHPARSLPPIDPNALAWFQRVRELYLEPFASGDREWPFVISIQDTSVRKVGMHFINKTGLDFRQFAEDTEEYHRAARASGFVMDISVHPKGHHRLAITRGEATTSTDSPTASQATTSTDSPTASQATTSIDSPTASQDADPKSMNGTSLSSERTHSPLARVIPRPVVAFPERPSLPDLTVGC